MNQRWLGYLSIGVLSGIVLLLFALRLRPAWTPEQTKPLEVKAIAAPTITYVDPTVGPANAKVTIVEFGDFQCGPCGDTTSAAHAVQAAFPDSVRVVWKHAPNDSIHANALSAAVAAQCAQRQNKFWEYADSLFRRSSTLTPDQYADAAQEVGLDVTAFNACNESQDTLPVVTRDREEALGLGLTATPTTFINGTRYVGALSVDELTGYVNAILHPQP